MPTKSTTLRKVPSSYIQLLHDVRKTLLDGQARIESQRVRTYWQTGQHIAQHILKYSDRAQYGSQTIARLANDLNLDKTTLHDCVQFAQVYPRCPIVGSSLQLTWTHFREFIRISDEKERKRLQRATHRNGWTVKELIQRVEVSKPKRIAQNITKSKPVKQKLLTPLRGEPYTYKIIKRSHVENSKKSGLCLDLGFGASLEINPRALSQLKEGDFVTSTRKAGKYSYHKKEGATDKDRFTYYASIERIIDADTFKVNFDLGFKTHLSHTIRLRGLDCPEIKTKEGVAAKNFVQSYIKEADRILVRSSRDDKYGRFLADVFILSPSFVKEGAVKQPLQPNAKPELIFLNNLLLEHGHAVRM